MRLQEASEARSGRKLPYPLPCRRASGSFFSLHWLKEALLLFWLKIRSQFQICQI
jgi:hypothetical protein